MSAKLVLTTRNRLCSVVYDVTTVVEFEAAIVRVILLPSLHKVHCVVWIVRVSNEKVDSARLDQDWQDERLLWVSDKLIIDQIGLFKGQFLSEYLLVSLEQVLFVVLLQL